MLRKIVWQVGLMMVLAPSLWAQDYKVEFSGNLLSVELMKNRPLDFFHGGYAVGRRHGGSKRFLGELEIDRPIEKIRSDRDAKQRTL